MLKYENENGRLVTSRVGRWAKTQNYISYEDLLSIGYIALVKAERTYDETKGVKFSTYAIFCIDNAIKDEIRKEANYKKVQKQAIANYIETKDDKEEKENFLNLIEEALNKEEKKLVYLYFYQRKTLKEIAEANKTNEVNIYRRLEKIKKKLRENI